MAKTPSEDLHSFLLRQEPAALVAVLLELARDHDEVHERLARMQLADRPDKLAAGFRKTLSAWRRSTRFHGYHEAREFGNMLEGWLEQVARELLPKDPAAALALFATFIEADASWFERADDSDGAIGDAVRAACRHWLQAAARCEIPAGGWPERLMRLAGGDAYGAREELLRRAELLLDEVALRSLVVRYEGLMSQALDAAPRGRNPPYDVFKISAALSLLAEALGDPDVKVRAVLRYSPEPNPVQQEDFARTYLGADRPSDALPWLRGPWGRLESTRLELLTEALGKLGRFTESAPIRQRLFERTLSVFSLQRWLEHLPEAAHSDALGHARQLALGHGDPTVAATLLLELGDPATAEQMLLAEPGRIAGADYGNLVPLAEALRASDCSRGETAVYRALLRGILDRAYARAYGHAARYWLRLRQIADSRLDLAPLQSHLEFESEIRSRHMRKSSFWVRVNGNQSDRHAEDEDLGT